MSHSTGDRCEWSAPQRKAGSAGKASAHRVRAAGVVLVLVAACSAQFASAASAAVQADPPSDPPVSSLGPVIDPDVQAAEAQAEEARTGGVWSGSPPIGAKAGTPEMPPLKKVTLDQARTRAEAETAKRNSVENAQENADDAEVITTEVTASGTIKKIYDPAPGVSADTLAANLQKAGKPSVSIQRTQTTSRLGASPQLSNDSGPNACQYQYANTYACPNVFWRNNGFADPRVRMNDHTGSNWSVDKQVPKWYQDTPGIDMYYLYNSCPLQAGARCVDAYSGNYGYFYGAIGLTTLQFEADNRTIKEQGAMVQYNDSYNPAGTSTYGPFSRDEVTLHELGHVLGLGHNTFQSDVMYAQASTANANAGTGGQNTYLIGQVYSVTR